MTFLAAFGFLPEYFESWQGPVMNILLKNEQGMSAQGTGGVCLGVSAHGVCIPACTWQNS